MKFIKNLLNLFKHERYPLKLNGIRYKNNELIGEFLLKGEILPIKIKASDIFSSNSNDKEIIYPDSLVILKEAYNKYIEKKSQTAFFYFSGSEILRYLIQGE